VGFQLKSVEEVIAEVSSIFRIPPPRYDYDLSECGSFTVACFDPLTYTIHLPSPSVDPGVVAHEVGHAAHSYYGIEAGSEEYETFAQFTEQLYKAWKTQGYGVGSLIDRPVALEPRLLPCPTCGSNTLPNIYPYSQCYTCGQWFKLEPEI